MKKVFRSAALLFLVYNHVRTGHFANNVNEFAKCHIKRIF